MHNLDKAGRKARLYRRTFACAAIVLAAAISLDAQWIKHQTPGLPRLPGGKPDLNAPAPRTAEGKPDRGFLDGRQ